MIIFIFGTTAEAIKLAPIARRLEERNVPYESWLTLQHTTALLESLPRIGFRKPVQAIANGRNGQPLKKSSDVLFWLAQIIRWLRRNRSTLRKTLPKKSVIVVHGDTMTSVVGALIARSLKLPCAHVEAGLRSGNWRHPFPEELDRRIVGRLANIHYAPSEEATENLTGRTNVVFTHGNTAIDAVLDQPESTVGDVEDYGIVLLHRFEFLANRRLVEDTMATLTEESPHILRFFVDEYAKEALSEILLKADRSRIRIENKLDHEQFVSALNHAQFVVTDSGGIQAEAALIGVPTLIHRMATEQREGLGKNIVLSEWRQDRLSAFLNDFRDYRHTVARPTRSPSDIIVDDLAARGYLN